MAVVLKSISGIPQPAFPIPKGVVLAQEARTARRRFYPATILLTTYSLTVLAFGFATHPAATAAYLAMGVGFWTLLEYLVHRFVLHGRFPDGPGALRHRMHTFFDTMHGDHHLRPWDGMYINGYLDALPFGVLFAIVSFLIGPHYKAPVFVAGLLQSYVLEEWVHYSVHFCFFKGRYFRYIRYHHWYHHSRRGGEQAFGLTSGIWDLVSGTQMPTELRFRTRVQRPARPAAVEEEEPQAPLLAPAPEALASEPEPKLH